MPANKKATSTIQAKKSPYIFLYDPFELLNDGSSLHRNTMYSKREHYVLSLKGTTSSSVTTELLFVWILAKCWLSKHHKTLNCPL